jgi:superfamily II DNA helicase RecQ
MDSIDDLLQRVFQLAQFRPHQREIIQDVVAGNDVVCVMPTGAGKSLCFQLPALMLLSFNLADGRSGETTAAAECSRSIHE